MTMTQLSWVNIYSQFQELLCQDKDIEQETMWNQQNMDTKVCFQREEMKFIRYFKMKNMIALQII